MLKKLVGNAEKNQEIRKNALVVIKLNTRFGQCSLELRRLCVDWSFGREYKVP